MNNSNWSIQIPPYTNGSSRSIHKYLNYQSIQRMGASAACHPETSDTVYRSLSWPIYFSPRCPRCSRRSYAFFYCETRPFIFVYNLAKTRASSFGEKDNGTTAYSNVGVPKLHSSVIFITEKLRQHLHKCLFPHWADRQQEVERYGRYPHPSHRRDLECPRSCSLRCCSIRDRRSSPATTRKHLLSLMCAR